MLSISRWIRQGVAGLSDESGKKNVNVLGLGQVQLVKGKVFDK